MAQVDDVLARDAANPTVAASPTLGPAEGSPNVSAAAAPAIPDQGTCPSQDASLDDTPIPTPYPPADLQVRLNDNPALGFCVYALRPFYRGETLFRERTALEATHDADRRGVRNVYQRYCGLSPERRHALHGSFPHLAWANGVDAHEAADARALVGSRLLRPAKRGGSARNVTVLDIQLTAEDHMRMRPDWADIIAAGKTVTPAPSHDAHINGGFSAEPTPPESPALSTFSKSRGPRALSALSNMLTFGRRSRSASDDDEDRPSGLYKACSVGSSSNGSRSGSRHRGSDSRSASRSASAHAVADPDRARRETLNWFSRYAFRLKPGSAFAQAGSHHQAAVYLLTDLINHRCVGFQNCRVAAEVGTIAVVALRDIAVGEEVTINYSKDVKDFQCKGECCA